MSTQATTLPATLHCSEPIRVGVYTQAPDLATLQDVLSRLQTFLASTTMNSIRLVISARCCFADDDQPRELFSAGVFHPHLADSVGPVVELVRVELSKLCYGHVAGLGFKNTHDAVFAVQFFAVPGNDVQQFTDLLADLRPHN